MHVGLLPLRQIQKNVPVGIIEEVVVVMVINGEKGVQELSGIFANAGAMGCKKTAEIDADVHRYNANLRIQY